MDFGDLVEKRVVEPSEVPVDEIAGLMRVAQRDVGTGSGLMLTDLHWAFAVAYNLTPMGITKYRLSMLILGRRRKAARVRIRA